MEAKFSVSEAGVFKRISIVLSEGNKPPDSDLSAIIKPPSGREEIFLPSPDRLVQNVTYPHTGGRFVTCTGKGKYQIIFQPKEKGVHEIRLIGRVSGKPFEKAFQMSF